MASEHLRYSTHVVFTIVLVLLNHFLKLEIREQMLTELSFLVNYPFSLRIRSTVTVSHFLLQSSEKGEMSEHQLTRDRGRTFILQYKKIEDLRYDGIGPVCDMSLPQNQLLVWWRACQHELAYWEKGSARRWRREVQTMIPDGDCSSR